MKERDENQNDELLEAAALKYDAAADRAPQITALGKGYVAKSMLKAARENNVQIVKDAALSPVLHKLNVGDEIPEQLYKAVAEILLFISNIDNERKTKFGLK